MKLKVNAGSGGSRIPRAGSQSQKKTRGISKTVEKIAFLNSIVDVSGRQQDGVEEIQTTMIRTATTTKNPTMHLSITKILFFVYFFPANVENDLKKIAIF